MGLRDFTLEAFYTKETPMSEEKHPTTMVLKLWKNKYRLQFSNAKMGKKKSIMKSIDYQNVVISPTIRGSFAKYDLSIENRIILKGGNNEFSKEQVEEILDVKNPIVCELRKKMTEFHCRVI